MPSTTTLPSCGNTDSTRPVFEASSPAITCTKSSFFTCMTRPLSGYEEPLPQPLPCKERGARHSFSPLLPGEGLGEGFFSPSRSNDLGSQADDLQIALVAQLTGHRAEDTRAARVFVFLVQQHHRIAVEADVTAVLAPRCLLDPDDHALDHITGFDVPAGDGLLDTGDDDIAQAGIASPCSSQHLDAHAFLGAGVVGHIQV